MQSSRHKLLAKSTAFKKVLLHSLFSVFFCYFLFWCLVSKKTRIDEDSLDDYAAVDSELTDEDRAKLLTPWQKLFYPLKQNLNLFKYLLGNVLLRNKK